MRPLTCCLHDGREAPGADRSPTGRARNGEKSPDSPICARTAGDARSRVTRPFSYSSQAQGRMVEFMKSLNYRLLLGKTNPTRADRTIYQKEIFGWKRPDHSMFVISSMAAAVSAQSRSTSSPSR